MAELDPEQRTKILELLPPLLAEKDLTKTSLKEVRGELEQRMGLQPKALDPFREVVKELTTAEIRRLTDQMAAGSAGSAGSDGQPAEKEATDEPAEATDDFATTVANAIAEAGAPSSPEAAAPSSPESSPAKKKSAAKPKAKAVAKGKKRTSSPPAPAAAKTIKRESGADEAGKSEKPKREFGGAKARQKDIMTRSEFMEAAKTHVLEFAGQQIKLPPKTFSTGSVGFGASQKIKIAVGDCAELQLQCSVNFIVVGSKEWKEG